MTTPRNIVLVFAFLFSIHTFGQTGCTDYHATNYDPSALINDGSCIYPFTTLPLSFKCYIDSLELFETSGIVNQENNFWTHVDDANNAIYRIDTASDSIFQKVTINNSSNHDWEDITSDNDYIYVGDVGNNDGNRTNLRFYKILKSNITPSSASVNAGRINFSYSDQVNFTVNHNYNFYDCEAFFCLRDTIHMFTKGWVNKWTKHYVLPVDTGIQVAQLVDSFNVAGLITSAAIQGDSLVVLLGLNFSGGNNCFVWMLNDFHGSDFFSGNKRRFSIGSPFTTGQTEGICFTDTNRGFITNERITFGSVTVPAQLRAFNLNPYLAPPPPSAILHLSATAIQENLHACADSSDITFAITNSTAAGGQNLNFTIGSLPPWLHIIPTSGLLAPGDSTVLTVQFTSGTFIAGNYAAAIPIQSNDVSNPLQYVNFTMNVDSTLCMDFTYVTDSCTGATAFYSSSVNSPTYYYWDFGDGNTSTHPNPTHTYSANGNFVASLIACNSFMCDTVVLPLQAMHSGPAPASCIPITQSYCCGRGITFFHITGPHGDVINNISGDAIMGYEEFTCTDIGSLFTNVPYALTCSTSTLWPEYLKVWLDMNNDGILDTLSEELFFDLDTTPPFHTGTIFIPDLPGNVYGTPIRMRIASDYQQIPQPCLDPQFGQHEDYSIVLNFSVGMRQFNSNVNLEIHPNPFSTFATIHFELAQSSSVELKSFNILGENIFERNYPLLQSGHYEEKLHADLPGIYIIKLKVNDRVFVKRIVKTF